MVTTCLYTGSVGVTVVCFSGQFTSYLWSSPHRGTCVDCVDVHSRWIEEFLPVDGSSRCEQTAPAIPS